MTYTGSDSWETFKPYAVCIPRADVTDYQVKISDPVNNANGQSDTAGSPYCGPGTIAIGAGVMSHNPLEFISSLYPTSDPHYWLATVTNTANVNYTEHFNTYSVCVTGSALSSPVKPTVTQ